MSSPIDNYRNYLARNYSDMKLPAGKPYGVIKLVKGYDFGFHVRKDHISVNFISNGTHDPEEVLGYINDNGIGGKTYGDGLEPDVFRGKRNAAVVRCEVHIPLESVDELRKPTLRKHSQQIFGELYDDFSGIAGVERPKPKEDTAETPFNFNPDFITKKIAKYYKLVKIKGANTHSLRKTFGSLLIQNNVADIYTVSKLLGHASVKTTEKYYVDLVEDNYKSALNGLDKII